MDDNKRALRMDRARAILRNAAFLAMDKEHKMQVLEKLIAKGLSPVDLDVLVTETRNMTIPRVTGIPATNVTFETLIGDPLFEIIRYLDYQAVNSLCSTDRRLRSFCETRRRDIWRYLVARDFPESYPDLLKQSSHETNGSGNYWKKFYIYATNVKEGRVKFKFLAKSPSLYIVKRDYMNPIWANPSGLAPNPASYYFLRLDKTDRAIAYYYPTSYSVINSRIRIPPGENHPINLVRVNLNPPPGIPIRIEEIPWDESVLGEQLRYTSGKGIINWYNSTYTLKFSFDGGTNLQFTVYSVEPL